MHLVLSILLLYMQAAADVAADRLAALAPYVSLAAERVRAQQPQQGGYGAGGWQVGSWRAVADAIGGQGGCTCSCSGIICCIIC